MMYNIVIIVLRQYILLMEFATDWKCPDKGFCTAEVLNMRFSTLIRLDNWIALSFYIDFSL